MHDGAVLPILHLNGYKISNPTVLSRIPHRELRELFEGYGYRPLFVEGDYPPAMHQLMAAAMDEALDDIATIQRLARTGSADERPKWPMIIFRSPKGWTGPKEVDGLPTEGSFRSHQVPLNDVRGRPGPHRRPAELAARAIAPTSCSMRRGDSCPRSRPWRRSVTDA